MSDAIEIIATNYDEVINELDYGVNQYIKVPINFSSDRLMVIINEIEIERVLKGFFNKKSSININIIRQVVITKFLDDKTTSFITLEFQAF